MDEPIRFDDYVSLGFNEHHAKIDQYQTYSLIFDDMLAVDNSEHWEPGITYVDEPEFINISGVDYPNPSYGLPGKPAKYYLTSDSSPVTRDNVVAFDTFIPDRKIPFDFSSLAVAYPYLRGKIRKWQRCLCFFDALINGFTFNYNLQEWTITEGVKASYRDLITGHPSDSRKLPVYMEGIATSDRVISYGYYRRNELEDHPKVWATIDWLQYSQRVTKGKKYRLAINNPVLGTLDIDALTLGELIDRVGDYPKAYLPIGAAVGDLIVYWTATYTAPDVLVGTVGALNTPGTYNSVSGWAVENEQHLFRRSVVEFQSATRVLAATNDRWQLGSFTASLNPPTGNHPAFQGIDDQTLFYQLNSDNSIGTLIMDSPRIKEIHQALEAGKYATDPDLGGARVANLGWLIENSARVLGLRRKPDGKVDMPKERDKYKPKTLMNPYSPQGEHYLTTWGDTGRYMPFLPTTYNSDGKEEKRYDVVSDLPQMLEAMLRQLDVSLGVQHGSEIRVKGLDGKIQAYPNQLALLLHLANQIEQIKYDAAKTRNVTAVSGQEIRELFSGIGIPSTQKYLPLVDPNNGKEQQLPYFGHQKNQPSIANTLATLAVNIGVIVGAIMPKKPAEKTTATLNPFERWKGDKKTANRR